VAPGVEPSFAARISVWKGVLAMVGSNPLSGTGLGTFGLAYPMFKHYGEIGNWLQAHNDYLQVLAESGLVGFALLVVGVVLLARRHLLPVLRHPWRGQDPVALGAALGIVPLLLHSLADFNLQISSNGLLFVVLSGLLVRFHSAEPSPPDGFEPREQREDQPETP
jgi:O-antigen ligase